MQITILGPLAIDGRPVRGERLVAVVRELVDARGRAVSSAALADAVWDGAPPENAAGAIQALMSRARRLGLPVTAVPGGYRMPASEVQVDAVEARALVERAQAALRNGDPAAARTWSDQARALFPTVPELVDVERTRLLADIVGARAQAALAGRGAFDEADLRRLVAHTPPDEPSAALLVRVLAAQGRDSEALEVVERLRAELAERYGTDPSPVVERAHLALLRGELRPDTAPTPTSSGAALPGAWRRSRTALVGRDREVAAVAEALADAPLVTVVATGGAGKTRLAAEVARRAAAVGQPVRVVELASLRSPDEVLPAVLAAIGATDPATRSELGAPHAGLARVASPEDQLRAAAQDLDGLVVLDNCEHLLAAVAAVVTDLLAVASTRLAVLATSRAPLSLLGEVVHRLPALPDGDALRLLEARARAGGAVLTGDDAHALELCHRLDNLPLALELAAARLRHMPVDDVLAGLTDRFALLDDALRGLPDRHASLWAMVDWSHELLGPGDRALLQRLAVVPGSFSAELAAAVAGAADVRRGLASLVEQSLLALDGGDGGPPRYRMLETVREYGDVRLDAVGGRDAAMAGLVAWARTQAIAMADEFVGPAQLDAFARCLAEQDILIAALRWSVTHDDDAATVDLAATLFRVWTARGLHLEVVSWAKAVMRVDDPVGRSGSAILHGRAAGRPLPHADRLAWTYLLVGTNGGITDSARLVALVRRGVRTLFAQRPSEVSPRASALLLALRSLDSPEPEPALEAAAGLIAHPDPYVQGFGLFLRAAVRENYGLPGESAADAEQAYRRFEAVGDHWGMGLAAVGIGERVGSGGRADAEEWLRRGELHLSLVGAAQDVDAIRVKLDVRRALAGDPAATERLTETSTSAEVEAGDAAQAHLGLAHLACQQERFQDALAHAEAAVAIVAGSGIPWPQPRVMLRIAAAALCLRVAATGSEADGEHEARAVALLTLAPGEAFSGRDLTEIGTWALAGAALAAHRGDTRRARDLWTVGTRLGANLGYLFPLGYGERLAAALGEDADREPLLAAWRDQSVAATASYLRELMSELLL